MQTSRDFCIHDGYSLPLVLLDLKEREQALELANSLANLDYRANINGTTSAKMRADFASGKMAEFGAARYLAKHHGFSYQLPDLEIRSWEEREDLLFDADFSYQLNGRTYHIHVKSLRASYVKRFEESYNVHTIDNVYANPSKNDWLCLCIVDDAGGWVQVRGIVRATWVKDNGLWQPARLERMQGCRFLYWAELSGQTQKAS